MRFRVAVSVILLLVVGVFCAPPLLAQEQRGAIEGVVKDSSGAVLPGVTVEAKNVAVGSAVTAVTDSSGVFRFPALAPGRYDVTANLSGFAAKKYEAVEILLGQIKKVDFALAVAGVTETVQVSAESPLVDVRQSARATSLREEQIDLLPKGRDFMTVVTQAPGANNEAKSGGVMIDGATTSENRYIVDGAETSDIVSGGSGKALLADFIEEVQVKSSGYTAEYGGATGGVINVLTKSGTNNWRGNVLFYGESSNLGARGSAGTTYSIGQKTLRLSPANADVAEYITYPRDDYYRVEPGFSVGGPLARNKTWFFVAYQPTFRQVSRDVTSVYDKSTVSKTRKLPQQYLSANNTAQIGSKLRTRVAYNNSWSKTDGALPSLDGSDTLGLNYGYGTKYPNQSLSGQADIVARQNLFFGLRAGYYNSSAKTFNIPVTPRYIYRVSAIGNPLIPAQYQQGTGFVNVLSNSAIDHDTQTRIGFQSDATWYGRLGGQHTIKGGFQLDHLANDVLSYETGPYGQVYWGRAYRGVSGKYGYIRFRNNLSDPSNGFETTGKVATTNYGLFIQDAWTISNRLTVNLGLRTENEKILPYETDLAASSTVKFGFGDKLAPRVGFAWDLKGDGKWKAYGSWGIFYDIFKMNLGRGSFGGEKWMEYWYALETPDVLAALKAVGPSCPPNCPSNLLGKKAFPAGSGGYDYRSPGEFDPSLKPMKQQEASFGLEHQLSPVAAVSARYVRKWLNRAVDDTGSYDPNIGEIYVIANPGFGKTTVAWPDLGVPLPKADRTYDAVELAFTKNLSHSWYFRGSYLWSRLYGNYSGLDQTDENGRQSPNTGRLYDYPLMSFDQKGYPVEGPLATDRPHQVKAQLIYNLPFGTSIGVNQYVASGVPKTREMAVIAGAGYPMFYMGRGSDGRMPVYSQTDLYIQHEFKLGGNRRVQGSVNVINLFNQSIATNFFPTWSASGYQLDVPEGDIYAHKAADFNTLAQQQGIKMDPRFLLDQGWQLPIQVRFGLKFLF